ncbi:MAG: MoaD/ThiS family protein [Deltaproteobacteria bacterium]|nr:MoaD/ThiS family protein [Deltaproteobacteria bacterium]
MKIRVKLFGTLKRHISGYDPVHGLEVEIPDGAKVKDLLSRLEIQQKETPIVTVNHRIVKTEEKLIDGSEVNLIQQVSGG